MLLLSPLALLLSPLALLLSSLALLLSPLALLLGPLCSCQQHLAFPITPAQPGILTVLEPALPEQQAQFHPRQPRVLEFSGIAWMQGIHPQYLIAQLFGRVIKDVVRHPHTGIGA